MRDTKCIPVCTSIKSLLILLLVVAFAKCQRKKKNLPTSPVLVPIFITILAADARISTTSTPRSYISAMLLALKSLLFFCLDIWNLKLVEFQTAKGK